MKLKETSGGVLINIHVKPNSKQFKIAAESDELVVLCREAPVKGRVNRELIRELSRVFKRRVEIITGFTSRQKKILVKDITADEAKQILDGRLHK